MSWKFFTNSGQQKTFDSSVASSVSTVASASSIAVTGPGTYLLTGTTTVATITGGAVGMTITVQASAQASGTPVVLTYGAGSNAIKLSGGRSLGLYAQVPADTAAGAGESVTLRYDGTAWVEIARDLRTVLDYVQGTANTNITATTAGTANTIVTATAFTSDGATPIDITYFAAAIDTPNVVNGTVSLILYEDGTNRGHIGDSPGIQNSRFGFGTYITRFTPASGARTYSMRGYVNGGTGVIQAGAGTTTTYTPTFIKISRAL